MTKRYDFKIESKEDIKRLLDNLKEDWTWDNYIKITGKWVIYLELHTGGWSGNEAIIAQLQKNRFFWFMFWEKSTRGGHYYFRIDTRVFVKPLLEDK